MDEGDWLAARFEEHRGRLRAVAYRLLGPSSEADDAVQEAWLRLSRAGASGVENLGGCLTMVVARVCLNVLEARAAATSRRCSRCSTRMSCCDPTAAPCPRARRLRPGRPGRPRRPSRAAAPAAPALGAVTRGIDA